MSKIYIMTIPTTEVSKRVLIRLLRIRTRGKDWQFGIEKGHTTGYEHYQIRYRSSEDDFTRERGFWTGYQCNLEEASGWSSYELKDGNFYTSLDDSLGKYRWTRLSELQYCILAHGRTNGDRLITTVCDKVGGTGKTFLARWMCLNGKGIYIDGSGRAADIIADVYDISMDRKIERIFIDLTRNANADRVELWSAIEQVKNGYLKDSRYQHREKWIKPPEVFVFCNREPKWDRLSKDRWDKMFINQRRKPDGRDYLELWDRDTAGNPRVRNFYRNN